MNLTPQALDFLFENRIKDSKPWYREHKELHKQLVVEPFREFVSNMQPYIDKIDPNLSCNPKHISRIYRDTRFTKDKSIFRDHVWYGFMHGKELYEGYPCYYFEFSPEGFTYGCGYYKAGTKTMEAVRELVLKHDKSYLALKKLMKKHKEYIFYSNPYKKNHFPDAPEEDLPFLNIRDFAVSVNSRDFDLLFSDSKVLAEAIGNKFLEMKPIYDFLMKAESTVQRENQ